MTKLEVMVQGSTADAQISEALPTAPATPGVPSTATTSQAAVALGRYDLIGTVDDIAIRDRVPADAR
jgi:hypothetical protein